MDDNVCTDDLLLAHTAVVWPAAVASLGKGHCGLRAASKLEISPCRGHNVIPNNCLRGRPREMQL